jgi:hypothetical protein
MDHAHLILETHEVIEARAFAYIPDVGLGHAEGDLPLLGDHGEGAQTAVACEIEHVGGFGEEEHIEARHLHASAASFHPTLICMVGHRMTPLLIL